jgi:hypothetical protein
MSGGWGCPNEENGTCRRVLGRPCDPGMKGCILSGRFTFSNMEKNRSRNQVKSKGDQGKTEDSTRTPRVVQDPASES